MNTYSLSAHCTPSHTFTLHVWCSVWKYTHMQDFNIVKCQALSISPHSVPFVVFQTSPCFMRTCMLFHILNIQYFLTRSLSQSITVAQRISVQRALELILEERKASVEGASSIFLVTGDNCKRRTLCWLTVIFFNIQYNAFVIWMALNPEWNKGKLQRRQLFIEELGKVLVRPQKETHYIGWTTKLWTPHKG